jgi:hypothetical protein
VPDEAASADIMTIYTQAIEGCQCHSNVAVALIYVDHRNCTSHLCSLLCIQPGVDQAMVT